MDKTPPKQSVAKGGAPLPEGAKNVPGSARYKASQGQKSPGEVVIGKSFLANPNRGGPELIIGKKHIRVEGDKPREKR